MTFTERSQAPMTRVLVRFIGGNEARVRPVVPPDLRRPGEFVFVRASDYEGAVGAERERIANMLARAADDDERGGFDERTRTVLRSFARTIATGGQ